MQVRTSRRRRRVDGEAALAITLGPTIARAVNWAVIATMEEIARKQRGALDQFRADLTSSLYDKSIPVGARTYDKAVAKLEACEYLLAMLTNADSQQILESIIFRVDAVDRRYTASLEHGKALPVVAYDARITCEPCRRTYYATTKSEAKICPYCKSPKVAPEPLR